MRHDLVWKRKRRATKAKIIEYLDMYGIEIFNANGKKMSRSSFAGFLQVPIEEGMLMDDNEVKEYLKSR